MRANPAFRYPRRMALPVRLSDFAIADLSALLTFYSESREHDAHRRRLQLQLTVDGLFRQIQEFPHAYPPWRSKVRRVVTPRFFLAVYYLVLSDHILILGIADQRQDPRRLRFLAAKR